MSYSLFFCNVTYVSASFDHRSARFRRHRRCLQRFRVLNHLPRAKIITIFFFWRDKAGKRKSKSETSEQSPSQLKYEHPASPFSLSFLLHTHAQSLFLSLFWRVRSGCVMTEIPLFGLWGRGKGNNKPYCCFYCQINNIFIRCFSSSQIRGRWLIETCRIYFQLTQTHSVCPSLLLTLVEVWHWPSYLHEKQHYETAAIWTCLCFH